MESLDGISIVIPAAGVGLRMGDSVPKQYLKIAGKVILEHTISKFLAMRPRQVVVVVSPYDEFYKNLPSISNCKVAIGGLLRSDSVLAGLKLLEVSANDWVMVHDAVRPCFRASDVFALRQRVEEDEVGGLLGVQVADTIKKVEGEMVTGTIDRTLLWQAQTPQMFRFAVLSEALELSQKNVSAMMTDEASAIEAAGYTPLMVAGHLDNIKITRPDDLELASYYLSREASV